MHLLSRQSTFFFRLLFGVHTISDGANVCIFAALRWKQRRTTHQPTSLCAESIAVFKPYVPEAHRRARQSLKTHLSFVFLSIEAEKDLTDSYMTHEICINKMIQWFTRNLEQPKLKMRWTAIPSISPLVILLHACCQSRPFDVSHSNNPHDPTVAWTVKHWGSLEGFQRCILLGIEFASVLGSDGDIVVN